MKKVLIATRVMDEHAITIECALVKKGHSAHRWHGADFPSLQTVHCTICPEQDLSTHIQGPGIDISDFDFTTIWWRRPAKPVAPTAWLHPDDVPAATRESEDFWLSFPHLFDSGATWINHWESRSRVNNKVVQLREAKKIGLHIPKSLFGNNAGAIRDFIRDTPEGVIYKTFFPMRWIEDLSIAKISTTPIAASALPSDKVLQLTPGIFQRRIEKSHEIRVTFMGDTYFAMKINSQADPRGVEDFRRIPTGYLDAAPCVLPKEIADKCRQLMRGFNILFCSIDFIVDTNGNYVFLEINEQGQFIWMEQLCPELPILDAFTDFLCFPTREFAYGKSTPDIRVSEIYRSEDYMDLFEKDNELHVFAANAGLAEPSHKFGVSVTR